MVGKLFDRVDGLPPVEGPQNLFESSRKPAWLASPPRMMGRAPWYCFEWRAADGAPQRLLIDGPTVHMVPSQGLLLVRSIGRDASVRWGVSVATGWRSSPSSCAMVSPVADEPPLLRVDSPADINGASTTQFYALTRRGPALVRCTTMEVPATLIRNAYSHNHFRLGPEPSLRTADDWIDELESPHLWRRLAALTWLGGVHLDGARPDHPQYEASEQLRVLRAVRADSRLGPALQRLAGDPNPWVRDATLLALKPATTD